MHKIIIIVILCLTISSCVPIPEEPLEVQRDKMYSSIVLEDRIEPVDEGIPAYPDFEETASLVDLAYAFEKWWSKQETKSSF